VHLKNAEELKKQEVERKRLESELKSKMAEFETRAKQIVDKLEGKSRTAIKAALIDAKIPMTLVEKFLPAETAAPAAPAAPAAKAATAKKK